MSSSEPPALPHGWVWATVGDVAKSVQYGYTASSSEKKVGPKLLRITDLQDGEVDWGSVPYCRIDEQTERKYGLTDGDILFARTGATTGKTILVRNPPEAVFASYLIRVQLHDVVLPEYLYRFLNSPGYWSQLSTQGIAQPNANSRVLGGIRFPLAPLGEQRRIVRKIEQLLQELRTARQALQIVPSLMKRFRRSVYSQAFRGELTKRDPKDESAQKLLERIEQERRMPQESGARKSDRSPEEYKHPSRDVLKPEGLTKIPDTWAWTTVGQLATFIGSGITPLGGQAVYVSRGIPFIRSQNVYPDGLHLEDVVYVTPTMHAEMKRTHVQPNDVLLNITGASIGRSTRVPEGFGEANVNQHVCIIRTGWWVDPSYLGGFLNSPSGQEQIFATESGVTREGLNYGQIRAFKVPLAPLSEQKQIVKKIIEMFENTYAAEAAVQNGLMQAESLGNSVLAKAFRGELVPQLPSDEPASVLLQRIRSQHATPAKKVSSQSSLKMG